MFAIETENITLERVVKFTSNHFPAVQMCDRRNDENCIHSEAGQGQ
jgi:hypothetical protein